jgi:hypothetical protein
MGALKTAMTKPSDAELDALETWLHKQARHAAVEYPEEWGCGGSYTASADAIASLRADIIRLTALPVAEEVEAMAQTATCCGAVEPIGQAIAAMLRALGRENARQTALAKAWQEMRGKGVTVIDGSFDDAAEIARLTRALAAATERAEAAEKDAARYRWLRGQRDADIAACWYLPVHCEPTSFDSPEKLDAAIDAQILRLKTGI